MNFYDELKWRGLIKDEAGDDLEKIIKQIVNSKNVIGIILRFNFIYHIFINISLLYKINCNFFL